MQVPANAYIDYSGSEWLAPRDSASRVPSASQTNE